MPHEILELLARRLAGHCGKLHRFRFPLPCRGRASRRSRQLHLASQLFVHQPLAKDVGGGFDQSATVAVVVLAFVEAERLLVEVTMQVERLNADVGSLQGPLEDRPEVFDAVGMHRPVHGSFQRG